MTPDTLKMLIADALRAAPPGPEAQAAAVLDALEEAGLDVVESEFDEPLSPAEQEAHANGQAAIARGDYVTWEDLKAELDL